MKLASSLTSRETSGIWVWTIQRMKLATVLARLMSLPSTGVAEMPARRKAIDSMATFLMMASSVRKT